MNVGRLSQRVTIKRRAVGRDAIGQPVETWEDVATVWANIRHLSGAESIKADQDVSVVRASIRIRYRAGLDAGMRVHHGATVYEVKAVLPDEQRREHVDLSCAVVS